VQDEKRQASKLKEQLNDLEENDDKVVKRDKMRVIMKTYFSGSTTRTQHDFL